MQSAGPESTKLATYGPSSMDKRKVQGLRAPWGEDLSPIAPVGWQPTARVAGTNVKSRAWEHQGGEDLRPTMTIGWQPTGRVAETNWNLLFNASTHTQMDPHRRDNITTQKKQKHLKKKHRDNTTAKTRQAEGWTTNQDHK